jgi:putative ABC transport system substrate-binding protein
MHKTIKTIGLIFGLLFTLSAALLAQGVPEQSAKAVHTKIGISKLLAHPALDVIEQGIQDYLIGTGLPVAFDTQNANGDISTAASIAQKFKSDKADIVVGIATPTAQALANVFTDIPVVFSAITDPIAAGLADSYEGPQDTNVCGVSDLSPVESQIKLLLDLTGAKTIGNVYASNEANAVALMELAQKACDKYGVKLITEAVSNSAEVKMAALSIIDRVDAVYVGTDNTVISALASLADVCTKANKPLFSGDTTSSEGLDVFAAWGFNYYNAGVYTGKMIEQIINGAKPRDLGTTFLTDPSDFELWFNMDVVKRLGLTIPQDLLDSAARIVENGQIIK